MSDQDLFNLAELFLKNNPSCKEALAQLNSGVEIKISLNEFSEAALFYSDDQVHLEKRAAKNYDVEFILYTEALRQLSEKTNLSVAEVGIEFLKQVLLNHIEIKKHCSVVNFVSNGYVKIIKLAGPDFLSFLAKHGFGSLQKIINHIRN